MSRTLIRALPTAALLAFGARLLAAPPDTALVKEGVKSAVQVTAMDLDVVATKGGQPVTDLTKEEFRIKVDGKELPLDYFTRVTAGGLHGPDLATASPDLVLETLKSDAGETYLARQFLVFFDDVHMLPNERKRVLEGLRDLVTRLSPSDRMSIVSYNDTPRVLTPFTGSKEELLDGIARLERIAPRGQMWDTKFRGTVLDIRRARIASREGMIRQWSEELRGREEGTLFELRRAVSALAARSGKRSLVYVSSGLELFPGQSLQQALGPGSLVSQYDVRVTDSYRAVVADANRGGVTIHAFDARGLASEADASESLPSPFDSFLRNQSLRDTLAGFANETGGLLVADRNDFARAFDRVYADSTTYYSIGVTLTSLDPKKTEHAVAVSTTRDGVSLRVRRSYGAKGAEEAARDRLEMALITPDARGDFPATLQLGPTKKAGGLSTARIAPFEVRVPLSALTFREEGGARKATVEVTVAAVEDTGAKSNPKPIRQTISVAAANWESAQKETFTYSGELKSGKGNLRFVATVRDVASDRVAVASTAVRIE